MAWSYGQRRRLSAKGRGIKSRSLSFFKKLGCDDTSCGQQFNIKDTQKLTDANKWGAAMSIHYDCNSFALFLWRLGRVLVQKDTSPNTGNLWETRVSINQFLFSSNMHRGGHISCCHPYRPTPRNVTSFIKTPKLYLFQVVLQPQHRRFLFLNPKLLELFPTEAV